MLKFAGKVAILSIIPTLVSIGAFLVFTSEAVMKRIVNFTKKTFEYTTKVFNEED